MNILLVAAEVAPFAKVGGLADVAGALPKALKALGHDVRIVMPCYKMILDDTSVSVETAVTQFQVSLPAGGIVEAFVKQTQLVTESGATIPVYLVGNRSQGLTSAYFERAVDAPSVYENRPEPYVFFDRAVLEMLLHLTPSWKPDVLHCNDWHTGLVPVYLQTFYRDNPLLRQTATVYTLHNLAYPGNFAPERYYLTGLPNTLYSVEGLEFNGNWTFMKGGLNFSDRINTVSATYAQEIQTPEYGCGLDGLLRTLAGQNRLTGIVNGIDTVEFNPAQDPVLPAHYSAGELTGKTVCKANLQQELGLPISPRTPILGMVTRLVEQKGVELLREVAEQILHLPVQFVLVGQGDPVYERYFTELQARHPSQVRVAITYDFALSRRIYAGSDLFLMPSRFEPCGLGQLIALRYGTIPIVRHTGGLADTVQDFDPARPQIGNGFVFQEYSGSALLDAVSRAIAAYGQAVLWQMLVQRALRRDLSWAVAAQQYVALYTRAIQARTNPS